MQMLEIEDTRETRRVIRATGDALEESVAAFRRIGASLDDFAPSWRGEERREFAKTMEEFAAKAAAVKRRAQELCDAAERFMDLMDRSSEALRTARGF